MTKRTRRTVLLRRVQSQINVTPLIDVLLVLLVIFMVITPTTPSGLDAQIPQPSLQPLETKQKPVDALVLNVDENRVITLNRNNVSSPAELISTLQDIFKTRADRTIFVQGSKDLTFDDIVQVIDAATGAGASRIGLMTEEIR